VIFDTDVVVWASRGKEQAAKAINASDDRAISVISYLEILEGARDKAEVRTTKSMLFEYGFRVLPLSENIGHRACIYMELYGLSHALAMGDALVAATVVENNELLLTGNRKHFATISGLQVQFFKL
jgi:hypothetical protein